MTIPQIFSLARVPNIPTVWSNCLAAWIIAGAAPDWRLLPLMLGASLVYAGGCTLNDAFDAEWDRANRPERLIPAGTLPLRSVLQLGFAELLGGTLILGLLAGKWAALPVLLAICILIYDRWHKQHAWSVVTMAACRGLLLLSAGATALGTLPRDLVFHAAAASVFVWIVSISVIARGESRATPEKRSAAPFVLLLIPVLMAGALAGSGDIPSAAACGALLAVAAGLFILRGRKAAWHPGQWVARLLAAIPLLDAALVLTAAPLTARSITAVLLCLVYFFLAARLQRHWAAS